MVPISRIIIATKGLKVKKATAASYVSILDKCLKQCGVANFLSLIQFDCARLNNPHAFLDFDEFTFIVKEAYRLSACPYLGLLFGGQLSIGNHGFLGYAALTSPTLRTAIQTVLDFLNTRTGLLHAYLQEDNAEQACVGFQLLTEDALIDRFVTELAIVHLVKLHAFLINTHVSTLQMDITYAIPDYVSYYYSLLGPHILFDAPQTCVWFPASDLNLPMIFADDASYQQAKNQLYSLAEQLQDENLPLRVKNILRAQEQCSLTMEEVAKQCCYSVRTLRRHLQHHGISYQTLVDQVRQEKAKALLANPSLSITEISFLLGFNDLSNFTKAFKRWTQKTPSDYRNQS